MEKLTLGQVIDQIKQGQVAVRTSATYGNLRPSKEGLHESPVIFLNKNGILSSYERGGYAVIQIWEDDSITRDKYFLMDTEDYETIRNGVI